MPAVTVDNILTLPRIEAPAPDRPARPVLGVRTAPVGFEGEGFPVRRAFAGIDQRFLDPFIHMDQMGEVEYAPGEPKGTPWHPHRGFETVTYMIDGILEHKDSNGGGGTISNPNPRPVAVWTAEAANTSVRIAAASTGDTRALCCPGRQRPIPCGHTRPALCWRRGSCQRTDGEGHRCRRLRRELLGDR